MLTLNLKPAVNCQPSYRREARRADRFEILRVDHAFSGKRFKIPRFRHLSLLNIVPKWFGSSLSENMTESNDYLHVQFLSCSDQEDNI